MDQDPNSPTIPPITPVAPTLEPVPQPQAVLTPPTAPAKKMAIISIVVGTFGLVGGLFGIAAIVLGVLALKKQQIGKKLALAGIITGSIGIILGSISLTLVFTSGILDTIASRSAESEIDNSPFALRAKALVDSKKSFAKGETARFGYVDVTVNSAEDNYTDPFTAENEEMIKVNVTLTNKDADSQYIQGYLKLKVNGTVYDQGGTIDTAISSEQMQPGESFTGDLLFRVKKSDAPTMKLQYTQEDVYDSSTDKKLRLVWTLGL